MGARDGDEIKMDVRMMAAPCDEVGRGGGSGRGGGCPWIRPRYNLICGSRKE